jgi:hypothetical protein
MKGHPWVAWWTRVHQTQNQPWAASWTRVQQKKQGTNPPMDCVVEGPEETTRLCQLGCLATHHVELPWFGETLMCVKWGVLNGMVQTSLAAS